MSAQFTISGERIERTALVDRSPLSVRCGWLEQARRQLDAIAGLPQGWDSHGSPPPETRNVEAAWTLLVCLCQAAGLPKPHISPTPSGGVQFEWEQGPRYFEVELVTERAAVYLFCDDDAAVEECGQIFEEESLEPVLRYVWRVVGTPGGDGSSASQSRSFVEYGRYAEAIA
jgi:hypothetical protein